MSIKALLKQLKIIDQKYSEYFFKMLIYRVFFSLIAITLKKKDFKV